ncbi:restriction endonuclease subunit S [Escherichia coli]
MLHTTELFVGTNRRKFFKNTPTIYYFYKISVPKSNSASQPFVSYNILNAPIVLVPLQQEQLDIVEILDKFDTLTNSITEGLPREIESRQKQYEYYRDLLFSFPKPETVSN